jgi:hypothetical protein
MPATVTTHPKAKPQPGPGEHPGNTAKAGDLVTWHNPARDERWPDLEVEFAYPRNGSLLLRGHMGRFNRAGEEVEQTKPAQMVDCIVTRRAGERV